MLLRTEVSAGSWSGKGSNIHSTNLSVALELFAMTGRKRSIDKVLGHVSGFLTRAIFFDARTRINNMSTCPSMHPVDFPIFLIGSFRTISSYLDCQCNELNRVYIRQMQAAASSCDNLRPAPLKHSRQIR